MLLLKEGRGEKFLNSPVEYQMGHERDPLHKWSDLEWKDDICDRHLLGELDGI